MQLEADFLFITKKDYMHMFKNPIIYSNKFS